MSLHRQRVVRADGRTINIVQRRAHLFYCFSGCCCGRTDRGYAAGPVEAYKDEWIRRKAAIRCAARVIDSEIGPMPLGRARELAEAMGATYASLDALDEDGMLRLLHAPAGGR